MRKKERHALLAVALIATVGLGAVFGLPALSDALTASTLVKLGEQYDRTCAMGTDCLLDATKDSEAKATVPLFNQEVGYSAELPFTGSMTVRVDDAKLYANPTQAGISTSSEHLSGSSLFYSDDYASEGWQFLLCTVTLKNNDAQPADKVETRTGRKAFPFDSILFPDNEHAQPVYFDGTWEHPQEGEQGYFDLQPGEQKTVKVGYALPKAEVDKGGITLHAGTMNTSKYRFSLKIADMRGGASS